MAKVVTPEFRVNFPNVFKARHNKLSGKDEFGVVAVFPPGADLTKVIDAVKAAMVEKWGVDKTKWPKNMRSPFREHEERATTVDGKQILPSGYEVGGKFLNLKSKNRPGVVDAKVQPILDETEIYSGCYARATVNAFAYDQAGNRGVSIWLNNLQKTRDGDTIGGRSKPEEDFAPVVVEGNASAGSADELFS